MSFASFFCFFFFSDLVISFLLDYGEKEEMNAILLTSLTEEKRPLFFGVIFPFLLPSHSPRNRPPPLFLLPNPK